jgi:hypothetical protein
MADHPVAVLYTASVLALVSDSATGNDRLSTYF